MDKKFIFNLTPILGQNVRQKNHKDNCNNNNVEMYIIFYIISFFSAFLWIDVLGKCHCKHAM